MFDTCVICASDFPQMGLTLLVVALAMASGVSESWVSLEVEVT